jgi:hypothetical protein
MLRQLAAPVALDEPQVVYLPIDISRPIPRWGPPLWPADEPITVLARPSVAQVDIIALSVVMAYRLE